MLRKIRRKEREKCQFVTSPRGHAGLTSHLPTPTHNRLIWDCAPGDKPLGNRPLGDKPLGDRPLSDEPLSDRPLSDGPLGNGPLGDGPLGDEPLSDGPLGNEPLGDGPLDNVPIYQSALLFSRFPKCSTNFQRQKPSIKYPPLSPPSPVTPRHHSTSSLSWTFPYLNSDGAAAWDSGLQDLCISVIL